MKTMRGLRNGLRNGCRLVCRLVCHVVVVIALLGPATLARAGHPPSPENRAPLQPFVLNEYQGGQIDFADYRGRVVLVNFWATWCAPCVAEFPSLLALKDGLAGRPFEILAINMGERDDAITDFIGTLGRAVNFPILVDRPVITVATTWSVRVLPTTIIVDKAGNLAFKTRGERVWNSARARAIIRPLLRE